ncbi:MAG: LPP20 family lipoprotein [Myxococcota bacterium]|nr:LPP20 family lipoprotein [Myxococcota bacterium]
MPRAAAYLLGLALVLAVAACSSKGPRPIPDVVEDELDGAPEWVTGNCQTYWEDEDQRPQLCGVGSMGATRNISLAQTTATARARTEIARRLELRVQSILKDYQATTTAGAGFGSAANDEQFVTDTSKQITDFTLRGTEPTDSWVSEAGTYYSLVSLDLDQFRDALSQMSQLSDGTRRAVEERASLAFEELDAEFAEGDDAEFAEADESEW